MSHDVSGLGRILLVSKLELHPAGWHMPCGYFAPGLFPSDYTGSGGQLEGGIMNSLNNQKGAIGWILLWVLGIPIPILLLLFVVRGCT